jgi:hypothetical protein
MARRYVGVGLAKRTIEMRVMKGKKIERHGLKTEGKG